MSIPSLSCLVQIGVMALRASRVSLHFAPDMEPESSIRKTVSKVLRKAYGLSVLGAMFAGAGVYEGGGSELLCLNGFESVGGFAGRRVGGAAILIESARGTMGAESLNAEAVLSMLELFLLDLRWKRPKDGMLW